MPVTPEDINGLVETVWATVLGLDVCAAPDGRVSGRPDDFLAGAVEVRGAWEGVVALDCPAALARGVAGVMFDAPPDEVSEEQSRDALGEVVNILGGSLKAMLPGPSRLELPVVEGAAGPRDAVAGRPLFQGTFSCLGQPFLLSAVEYRAACVGRP